MKIFLRVQFYYYGRFGFDGDRLERTGLFEYSHRGSKIRSVKYPNLDITYMTAHSSKGLGYDDVIIINGKNETYGFPSKVEDDPVLAFVIKGDRSIDYAEERRLFYVAMTRTKNRVFMIAPEQNPSEFLIELKRDYKNVVVHGDWNENDAFRTKHKKCPLCGYPLQLKYKKSYGLRLYICSNEPEICGFMTNDYSAGKLSIQKCDKCREGYLIVKKGTGTSYFLGCTNYKKDGTGCNNTISKINYYKQMNYELEPDNKISNKDNKLYQNDNKSAITKNNSIVSDYVEIVKADLEPILFNKLVLNDVIYIILNALQNISVKKYYNKTILINVLIECNNKIIIDNNLIQIPEYGQLKNMSYDDIDTIIEWMINKHLILRTKERYPVLHSTYEGLHYSKYIGIKEMKQLKEYLEKEVVTWKW